MGLCVYVSRACCWYNSSPIIGKVEDTHKRKKQPMQSTIINITITLTVKETDKEKLMAKMSLTFGY